MQIWRTTRSALGTSKMKARLVRLCFDNAFPGNSCFVVDLVPFFRPRVTSFCVPECYCNRLESSTAEKVLFFLFFRSPLRENQRDGGKEFTVAEGIVKVQVGINLRKCVSDRI